MDLSRLFEAFGLTQKESQLYLFLLSRGSTSPTDIANFIDAPRSSVKYQADELVKKGFARMTRQGKGLLYFPTKPDKLFELIEKKHQEANRLEHHLVGAMGQLIALFNPQGNTPKVSFFEGVEGVRELLFHMVDEPGDLVSFGAGDYFAAKHPELVENFREKAYKEYRNIRVIRAAKYQALHQEPPKHMQNKYFRYVEELTTDIQVRENKMSIISIDSGAPMGVLIEHTDMTAAFRMLFEEMWESL